MTFVTTLRLRSGDRDVLERVVEEIRSEAERKGAEFKGPHTPPPEQYRVPQYKRVDGDEEFAPWDYTVYGRKLEIVGHDEFARDVAEWGFPDSIYVEAEIRPVEPMGS